MSGLARRASSPRGRPRGGPGLLRDRGPMDPSPLEGCGRGGMSSAATAGGGSHCFRTRSTATAAIPSVRRERGGEDTPSRQRARSFEPAAPVARRRGFFEASTSPPASHPASAGRGGGRAAAHSRFRSRPAPAYLRPESCGRMARSVPQMMSHRRSASHSGALLDSVTDPGTWAPPASRSARAARRVFRDRMAPNLPHDRRERARASFVARRNCKRSSWCEIDKWN